MTAESSLRERILAQVRQDYPPRSSGVRIFGRPAGPATGPGHPDLFGVALGRFFGLEIKMPGGKLTPIQEGRIRDLRSCGACVWVVRSPLAAISAIYQTKQGVTVMPDDPMDFDDWLKGLESTPAEAQAVPTGATETAALDAGLTVTTEGDPFDFEPTTEAAEHNQAQSDTLDAMLGAVPDLNQAPASVAANAALADVALPEPPLLHSPEEMQSVADATRSIQAEADEDQSLAYIVEVVKAVGDRVTETYEQGNRLLLQQSTLFKLVVGMAQEIVTLRVQMNALLQEIDVPAAVQEVEFEVPTPLDDVLPPPPVAPAERVRRRRKTG